MATKRTPANKGRRYPAEILTEAEVKALIGACSPRAPTGVRNRALIVTMWRAGLRVAEALALKPKDIDPAKPSIHILHGKGDASRIVGIDESALAFIQRWVDLRAARGINGRATLFCTLKGDALPTSYVRALLPRLAGKVGIDKRVHAHAFRHTMAAQLAAEGIPLNIIQAQLGHRNAATTSRYLNHIAPQQVIDAMRTRSW